MALHVNNKIEKSMPINSSKLYEVRYACLLLTLLFVVVVVRVWRFRGVLVCFFKGGWVLLSFFRFLNFKI
jgi:hypothetical protein